MLLGDIELLVRKNLYMDFKQLEMCLAMSFHSISMNGETKATKALSDSILKCSDDIHSIFLKSNIVDDVIAVWFEEFANLKGVEVFDQSVPTFIRQKPDFVDQVKVFISYNPPRNPYAWVNEWVTQRTFDDKYFVDSSTYLDDELGFTTKQQLDLIETYKKTDPDYYRWLYLGEAVGLGTQVYNMKLFKVVDRIPNDEYITEIFYGMDTGFMVSATACVACALTNKYNVYVLDTFYYDPTKYERKLSASEQAERVHDFINEITDKYGVLPYNQTIDSADGGIYTQ